MSITLPPNVVARLTALPALAVGALSDEEGRMLIDLRLTGTTHAPRVTLDTQAMRDRLLGKASRALLAQSTKLGQQVAMALIEQKGSVEDSVRKSVDEFLPGVFKRLIPNLPNPAPSAQPLDSLLMKAKAPTTAIPAGEKPPAAAPAAAAAPPAAPPPPARADTAPPKAPPPPPPPPPADTAKKRTVVPPPAPAKPADTSKTPPK